jgi:hypothetical protein
VSALRAVYSSLFGFSEALRVSTWTVEKFDTALATERAQLIRRLVRMRRPCTVARRDDSNTSILRER